MKKLTTGQKIAFWSVIVAAIAGIVVPVVFYILPQKSGGRDVGIERIEGDGTVIGDGASVAVDRRGLDSEVLLARIIELAEAKGRDAEQMEDLKEDLAKAVERIKRLGAEGNRPDATGALEEVRESGDTARLQEVLIKDKNERRDGLVERNREIAAVAYLRGDMEVASGAVDEILEAMPETPIAGDVRPEQTSSAENQKIAAEKERDFRIYSQAGSAHEAKEDWEGAIEGYTLALKFKPNDSEVKGKLATCRHNLYLAQAQAAESKGELDTAIRLYTTAISHKKVPSTQARLDSAKKTLQAEKSESRRRKYAKWLKLAETAEKEGSLTTAIQLYKEAEAFVEPQYFASLQAKSDSLMRRLVSPPIDYGLLNHRLYLKLKGNEWVRDACFSPSGELIASTDKRQVRVWDAATGACLRILKSNSEMLKAVCFSGDGKRIAAGDEWAKIIKIWDSSSGKCLRTIETEHRKDLFDISFSANGRFIVSASDDKTLKLWDVESGSLVRTFKGHGAGVFCAAFSPDGKCIASGSWDKTIRLWDVENGGLLKTLEGHTSTIESLAFSPDGQYIAACEYWGSNVMIWEVETARAVAKKHLIGALCVAFSPAGHCVAIGDAYGQVHILNVKNGEWVKKFKSHKGFLGVAHINAVGFSPDGKYIAVAADNESVKVFLFE